MDVKAFISNIPALYQRPVPFSMEGTPYLPSVCPGDTVDCVEIRTRPFSPANRTIKYYTSFDCPIVDKGSLIDLFA